MRAARRHARRPRGRLLAAIAAGYTAPAIARHFGVTEAGHAAIRAYERAHGLPAAIGGG